MIFFLITILLIFGLPVLVAGIARLLFEDESVLIVPENWREIARQGEQCERPCSDAAGTCDWRCPHLR